MDLQLPTSKGKSYIRDFCNMIYSKYIEFVDEENEINRDLYIQNLYNFAGSLKKPENLSKPEWNFLRMNIYLYLSVFVVKKENIPQIPLSTNDGPLFYLISIQYLLRGRNSLYADYLVNAFNGAIDSILKRDPNESFHSITETFFAKHIPALMFDAIPLEDLIPIFTNALSKFDDIQNFNFTDCDLGFLSSLIQILCSKQIFPQENLQFLLKIFRKYKTIPIPIIYHFFHSWRLFINQNKDKDKANPDDEITKLACKTLYKISLHRHHDLPRVFQWHTCFQFYESLSTFKNGQFKVFLFINNVICNVKRIDITNRNDIFLQYFVRLMKIQYNKNYESPYIFYFITNLISIISSLKCKLGTLKGIQLKNAGIPIISFARQAKEKNKIEDIDYSLYTKFDVKEFKTPEEEIKYYEFFSKTFENITKYLHYSITVSIEHIFAVSDIIDQTNNPILKSKPLEHPIVFYIRSIVKTWISFLISYSFRITMMSYYFYQGDGLLRFNGMPSTIRRQSDYGEIHRKLITAIYKLPEYLIEPNICELINGLKSAVKKQTITYHIVDLFFLPFCSNQKYRYIFLQKMMNIAINSLDLITSNHNSEVHFFNQWILLMLKIGFYHNSSDEFFFALLLNNQKLIISNILFFLRNITNPTETLKALDWYRHFLKPKKNIIDRNTIRLRRYIFDEIPSSSYLYAFRLAFDPSITNMQSLNSLSSTSYFFISAFESKDPEIISMAIPLFNRLVQKESSHIFCNIDYDKYQPLFSSFFESFSQFNQSDIKNIIRSLPNMSPFFVQLNSILKVPDQTFIFEPYGTRIIDMLKSIDKNLKDEESESIHLFYFYKYCLELLKKQFILESPESSSTLMRILNGFATVAKYEKLHQKVLTYLYQQNEYFCEHMVNTRNNAYFISLFSLIGVSRSVSTQFIINILHNFLTILESKNIDNDFISDLLDDVMSINSNGLSHFNLFVGFGIIFKHFPYSINIYKIFSLLSISSSNIQHDLKGIHLLNQILKDFLSISSSQIKNEFIQYIFSHIHTIWYGYRFVLSKRLQKLSIPLSYSSYDDFMKLEDYQNFILKILVSFSTGISNDNSETIISQNTIDRINSIIKKLDEIQNPRSIEPKVTILAVYYSIFKNIPISNQFFPNKESLESIFELIRKYILIKNQIIFQNARKCFKKLLILSNNYPNASNYFNNIIFTEKFSFLMNQESDSDLFFLQNVISFIPEKCPENLIKLFLEAIFDFCSKNDHQKMSFLPNYYKLMKILSLLVNSKGNNIRSIFSTKYQNKSFYSEFVIRIIYLNRNQNIPFNTIAVKPTRKIFVNFPNETTKIIFYEIPDLCQSDIDFYLNLVIQDETSQLMNSILKSLKDNIKQLWSVHPLVFQLLKNLVKEDRYTNDQIVADIAHLLFHKMRYDYFQFLKSYVSGTNGFMIMMLICKIYFRVIRENLNFDKIYDFSLIFSHPSFEKSNIYQKFNQFILMNYTNINFYLILIKNCISKLFDQNSSNLFVLDQILHLSIKAIHGLIEDQKLGYSHHLLDFKSPIELSNIQVDSILTTTKFLGFLWQQVEILKDSPNLIDITSTIVKRILALNEFDSSKSQTIIPMIFKLIRDSNAYRIIRGFKIIQLLQKHKALPEVTFYKLLSLFIQYTKYFETPYSIFCMQICKNSPELLSSPNEELIKSFLFFVSEKLPLLKDTQKLLLICQTIPKLCEYLPFPIVKSLTHLIHEKMKLPQKPKKNEINSLLISTIKICLSIKPPIEEVRSLFALCFKYMSIIIHNQTEQDNIKEFPESFCSLLLKFDCDNFEIKLIQDLISSCNDETVKIRQYYFGLLACSAKVMSVSDILQFKCPYSNAIGLISTAILNKTYVNSLVSRITNSSELWDAFSSNINKVLNDLSENPSDNNIDIIIIIIHNIIKSSVKHIQYNSMKYIDDLWCLIEKLNNYSLLRQIFNFLQKAFDDIPLDLQESYYNSIIAHVLNNKMRSNSLIFSAQYLIKSQNVLNSVKINFMEHLTDFLCNDSIETLERLAETFNEYEVESKMDLTKYKVKLLLHIIILTDPAKKVNFARQIISLIGKTPKERFSFLVDNLPLQIWSNKMLPTLSILILGMVPGWKIMISFSNYFEDVGSQLFTNVLHNLVKNDSNKKSKNSCLIMMKKLLISLNSTSFQEGVIKSLTEILSNYDVDNSLLLAQIQDNCKLLFSYGNKSISNLPDKIFLPHEINDTIFGLYRSKNIYIAAAEAQFFIGNYKESMRIFLELNSNHVESANNHMFNDIESTFDDIIGKKIYNILEVVTNKGRYDYLSQLYVLSEENDLIVSKLFDALNMTKSRDFEKAELLLNECENMIANLMKESKSLTLYEQDSFSSIESIICYLRKYSNGIKQKPPDQTPVFYINLSLNPIYQNIFFHLNKDLQFSIDDEYKPPSISLSEEETLFLSPFTEGLFPKVNGYNSHGFSNINLSAVLDFCQNYVASPDEKLSSCHFEAHKWAPACFELFELWPSHLMLSSAINSYVKLLGHCNFLPNFIKFEASARIITLLKIGITSKDSNMENECNKTLKNLSMKEIESETLFFWIHQIFDRKTLQPWFELILNNMNKYLNLLTTYSMKLLTYEEILNKAKDSTTFTQIRALKSLEDLINHLYEMDYKKFHLQLTLEKLFLSMKSYKTNNFEKDCKQYDSSTKKDNISFQTISLLEMRKHPPNSHFTNYLSQIPVDIVEKIQSNPNIPKNVNQLDIDEIDEIIEYLIPSNERTFKENKNLLHFRINQVNKELPLLLQTRVVNALSPSILFLKSDFNMINNDTFLFSFKMSGMEKHKFIIQKTHTIHDKKLGITLSSVLFLLKQILIHNYPTRIRSLKFSSYLAFDIGPNYITYAVSLYTSTLEEAFLMAVGEYSHNWVEKNGNNIESIEKLPTSVLKQIVEVKFNKKDFIKMRDSFIKSASSNFVIQYVFGNEYPKLNSFLYCIDSAEFPIMLNNIKIPYKEREFSTIRLSPNISNFFGIGYEGKILISFAAITKSLLNYFSSLQSYIEMIVYDQDGKDFSLEELIHSRKNIEDAILSISPPFSKGAVPSDSIEWIQHLDSIISKAQDPTNAPKEAIPWF